MRHSPAGLAFLFLVVVSGGGCRERAEDLRRAFQPPATARHQTLDSATAARYAGREPGVLGTVAAIPVEGWTGPGGRPFEVARRSAVRESGHARLFGTITLSVALRGGSGSLDQYPCTSCHAGARLAMDAVRIHDAHQNIQPVHPERTGAVCATCHAADDVEMLVLQGGGRATLDESYRLCGQCHFRQANAWAGGAHGKRLDGWQGRRVVLACTDCHDPHRPALQPQIPFRAPELQRPGLSDE